MSTRQLIKSIRTLHNVLFETRLSGLKPRDLRLYYNKTLVRKCLNWPVWLTPAKNSFICVRIFEQSITNHELGPIYPLPDYFSYRNNFHSNGKIRGCFTLHRFVPFSEFILPLQKQILTAVKYWNIFKTTIPFLIL